jgi:hypothetical protein
VDPGSGGDLCVLGPHETVIHRADTALALGAEFTVDEEVALDAFDEWMELDSLPQNFEIHPESANCSAPAAHSTAWSAG